jgi:hypothetical protein
MNATETLPTWLDGQPLPFHLLGGDKFENLIYLLLKQEFPNDNIMPYGQSKDGGRDVTRTRVSDKYYQIYQCKNFAAKLDASKVKAELAKLYTNIFFKVIPQKPNRISFCVPNGLTLGAKELITHCSTWQEDALTSLKTHLKEEPPSELIDFANEWWPIEGFDVHEGLELSTWVRRFPHLVDEFFRPNQEYRAATQFNALNTSVESLHQKDNEILQLLRERLPVVHSQKDPLERLNKLKTSLSGWEIEETISTSTQARS